MKRILYFAILSILCIFLSSCTKDNETAVTADPASIDTDAIDWRNDPNIGKVQPGYYKRVGIVKDGETYEEMLKMRETESKGYLIINDDGSAVFDLDGNITEYAYDEYKFYPLEDTKKENGISYTFIGGRIITDDKETITQYLRLSDEELESYLKSQGK